MGLIGKSIYESCLDLNLEQKCSEHRGAVLMIAEYTIIDESVMGRLLIDREEEDSMWVDSCGEDEWIFEDLHSHFYLSKSKAIEAGKQKLLDSLLIEEV